MAIYIDSALLKEVEVARTLGWIRGITTNPLLLAKAGRDAQAILSELANLNDGDEDVSARPLVFKREERLNSR